MTTELSIYQVDAFTDAVFGGNPAAVVPLRDWLPDVLLQKIAAENNLSETAFLVPERDVYHLRWFTPKIEVDLCGHATLASAQVVFEMLHPGRRNVTFLTRRAGPLTVNLTGDRLTMDFPARPAERVAAPTGLAAALGAEPAEVWAAGKLMVVFETEGAVKALEPDFRKVAALDCLGVIATAPGNDGIDFVSRYFAPHAGIDEDPVTGSAHCVLVPYWSRRLGKTRLDARQISARGGRLWCEDRGERVSLAGRAVLYLEGRIFVPSHHGDV
ncbi:putative isomerase [Aliidongia dinghuensis]|uniref:Putative isomerase n=1 Tax=Aliidongia dinghuensis TaxID=1867774 RepID=A0A8J3E4T5_9PROT|nr:PhzF family phenazine biosynthesis protein [Aliidongia dinghuensis]GGF16975.1 putative isomerase [Aliidongia dinghuensis]